MSLIIKNELDQSFLPQLVEFIKINHGENHVMTNDVMINHYFWNKVSQKYTVVTALFDNEIVGILGYIPTIFTWRDNKIKGAWTSHWTVNQDYRYGVGVLLMKRLQEMFPIIAGQGANQLNRKIVTKMGHHFLDHIQRSIKIYNLAPLKKNFPSCNFSNLKHQSKNSFQYSFNSKEALSTVSSVLNEKQYQPNWKLFKHHNYCSERNFNYIQEKYIDHPVFHYHFIIEGSEDAPYLIVFRLEETSGLAQFNCVRIVEVIFPTVNFHKIKLMKMLRTLDLFCLKNEVLFSDFYCTNSSIHNEIKGNGFEVDWKRDIPNLLNPVVVKPRDQNLELFLTNLPQPRWEEMYVTKSDGDQDRPNSNNLKSMKA